MEELKMGIARNTVRALDFYRRLIIAQEGPIDTSHALMGQLLD
jgi:hypothetical protein